MTLPEKSNRPQATVEDDFTVTMALTGAVAWGAEAIARAATTGSRHGADPLYDRLLAVQEQLTSLRNDWRDR